MILIRKYIRIFVVINEFWARPDTNIGVAERGAKTALTPTLVWGPVAHLVERLTCTEEVAGSSPVGSTCENKTLFELRVFYFCTVNSWQDSKAGRKVSVARF